MTGQISQPWARKRIENKVKDEMKVLPLIKTLEALKNGDDKAK